MKQIQNYKKKLACLFCLALLFSSIPLNTADAAALATAPTVTVCGVSMVETTQIPGASWYVYELISGDAVVATRTSTETSCILPVKAGETYTVRVHGVNSVGSIISETGVSHQFLYGTGLVEGPSISISSTGSYIEWEPVEGAAMYYVRSYGDYPAAGLSNQCLTALDTTDTFCNININTYGDTLVEVYAATAAGSIISQTGIVGSLIRSSIEVDGITGSNRISWQPVEQAASYELKLYQGSSTTGAAIQTVSTKETSYTFAVTEGTVYTVTIAGYDSENTLITKTATFSFTGTSSLAHAPGLLVNKRQVIWSDIDGAVSYHITVRRGSATVASTKTQASSYTLEVPAGYTYQIAVYACDATGKAISKTASKTVNLTGIPTKNLSVSLAYKTTAYNGKIKKPAVTIPGLKAGTDYRVSYSNNKNIGTATVTITGMRDYIGTKNVTFIILPKTPALKKGSAGKKSAKLTIQRDKTVTGYILYMSTKASSGYKKITTLNKNSKVKYTKKKLKKGKTYYFKVRSYKKIGGKTYTSAYSKYKKVKAK